MGGRRSRQKGKRGERATASDLREALPGLAGEIRRGWQTRMGDDEADVLGVPGWWFENKAGKKPNPRAALAQAIRDAKGRGVPVAVIRDDRKPPFVVMLWSDFLNVLKKVVDDGEEVLERRRRVNPGGKAGRIVFSRSSGGGPGEDVPGAAGRESASDRRKSRTGARTGRERKAPVRKGEGR